MWLVLVQFIVAAAVASTASATPTNDKTTGIKLMTTSGGAPVEKKDTEAVNSDILSNDYVVDTLTHFVRERIPERVVHAKGTGAFGYFEVTNDITNICKAKLFSEVGKKTPIAVRFSVSLTEHGGSDTSREGRGFAVKFYTEDGNFDIVGFSTPVFFAKDPALVVHNVHAAKPSPANHIPSADLSWDYAAAQPEALHQLFTILSDPGIPDGYRHMAGFGIHTFQVVNAKGVSSFVRFHFSPDAGVKNLFNEEAAAKQGEDLDYATRDLYDAIKSGNFPSWTVSVQILSKEDVKNASFDVFDVTKKLPLDEYPLTELGRFVLNRNPTNHFAEVEQIAYCPSNLVPGILGAPDKIFEARRMSYRDAANYRLGGNFQNIKVNKPINAAHYYNRDGEPSVDDNGNDGPNYYPNTYNGPEPYVDENRGELLKIQTDPAATNFDQAANMYKNEMSEDEQGRFVQTIVGQLKTASKGVQERVVKVFKTILEELGSKIEQGLTN